VAAADLYDGRHTLAKEITNNPNLPTYSRAKELAQEELISTAVGRCGCGKAL
jgi:hypothetical protein